MLCSICKKNMAVIFLKEEKKETALCLECAKSKGIDPMKAMLGQLKNSDSFNLENLTSQLDKFMQNLNPNELEELENSPFASFQIEPQESEIDLSESEPEKPAKKVKTKTLDTYGTNLTQKAKDGGLDAIIGRDRELDRMIQILNRRGKNNPVLIGEPGVGKTAIIHALAEKIASGNIPAKLVDKQIYLLDMTALVAGTQFRGQFESRVKGILDECKQNKNIILAIDEVHNIVGTDGHDNSMNAANMLKPALSNGTIQLIGATTLKEYRKYIEKDTALERRFQPILVDEPTMQDTVEILKGIKKYYEEYHKVVISDSVIERAVEYSTKYIHDRFLPDKTIDLIDEAASRVNLDNNLLAQATKLSFKIAALEENLSKLEEEQEGAIDYEKIASLKAEICKLQGKLSDVNNKCKPKELSDEHLAQVIELWTKIPVNKIKTSDRAKLLKLEENLKQRIIGQDHAIQSIVHSIMRKRAGIQDIVKPPSFIFVGPTGTGKTALVKALAYELFDSEDAVIKLDMSEYSESHSTSKLIGSPPGYVGYDEAGQLTEKVRRNPYSILLFDEIEKAHSSVFNMLLQILDEGKLTDAQGKTVSFKHTIIVLTSNLGTNFKSDGYGFSNSQTEKNLLVSKVDESLKNFFSPEFLNRIDEIITFNKLDDKTIFSITKLMIQDFLTVATKKGYHFEVSDQVISYLAKTGFDSKFGARPLKRVIQKNIEDLIAFKVISDEIKQHKKYAIELVNSNIVVQ